MSDGKGTNWRKSDLWWFFGFVWASAGSAEFEWVSGVIVFAGMAALQLVEMVLHAIADAVRHEN